MRALLSSTLLARPVRTFADAPPNAVIDWAAIVQRAIHHHAAPRSAGGSQILHAMVMLAIADAVVAVDGGYRPYAAQIPPTPNADV